MKKFKFNNKTMIGTTVIACILFGTLIFTEYKVVRSSPKVQILVATKNINQGDEIKGSDFIKSEYNSNDVSKDIIKSTDMLKNKYAVQDIYKGEPINKNRIASTSDSSRIFLNKDEKEISIPVNKINNDAFAGTLRKGDVVDITHTSSGNDTSISTELDMKKAEVIGAVDSQGRFLKDSDKNVLASSIMVSGTEQDFLKISKDLAAGYFTIAKSSIKK